MIHIHLLPSGDEHKCREFLTCAEQMINLQTVYNANRSEDGHMLTVSSETEHEEALQELYKQLSFLAHLADIELKSV